MAVQNSLVKAEQKKNEVTFVANGVNVTLTPDTVRKYLVSGDSSRVTMQELVMFINLCKFNGLNPWLKEAYCIKYGSEPATMVTSKDAYMKRAESSSNYDGQSSGIIVRNASGEIEYRVGNFYLPNEEIVGGYAEVWRKDRAHSVRIEVSFEEYAGRKKDGSLNRQWSSKPATMIRKVALVQALRESFPQTLAGMYTSDDQGLEEEIDLPNNPNIIDMPEQAADTQSEPAQETPVQQSTDAQAALFGNN